MPARAFTIRPFEPRDLDAAYTICHKVGNKGAGPDDDPGIIGHVYVGPYAKLAPELAYVAEDDEGVCGYILGALDSKRHFERYVDEWLPVICALHAEPTGEEDGWSRTEQILSELHNPEFFAPPQLAKYPSHLHIDLLPRAQGKGLGTRMISHMIERLQELGSRGVHLEMEADNRDAQRFFKRNGFREIARVDDIDVVYMGHALNRKFQWKQIWRTQS